MSAELSAVAADLSRVCDLERERLPELIGEAAALHARLLAALHALPAEAQVQSPRNGDAEEDRLLTAKEAAERLGVSKRWMYRKAGSLPFTRRLGAGTLRFSEQGLQRWTQRR